MTVGKVFSDWDSSIAKLLTGDRLRAWSVILAVMLALGCLGYLGLSSGGVDPMGRPIGTDFASFYTASKLAIAGHPDAAYDPNIHGESQDALFGRKLKYTGFFYPPIFLLYCLPLALVPYLLSLALWQGATFTAYSMVTRRFGGPDLSLLAIAAFPAVLVNLDHGQNAFLSTALFGAAILTFNTRPLIAGGLIGCLAYKPQLGIVIPFVLIAGRRWTTLFSAAATVLILAIAATLAFGIEIWNAFLSDFLLLTSALKDVGLVDHGKMQSTYAAIRLLGGSHALASVTQGAVAVCVVGLLVGITVRSPRRPVEPPLMVLAALLVTPYLFDYDLVLLAIPLAWLFAEGRRTGFAPFEKVTMLAAYVLPLFARPFAMEFGLPLGPIVIGALFAIVTRRMLKEATSGDARLGRPQWHAA